MLIAANDLAITKWDEIDQDEQNKTRYRTILTEGRVPRWIRRIIFSGHGVWNLSVFLGVSVRIIGRGIGLDEMDWDGYVPYHTLSHRAP